METLPPVSRQSHAAAMDASALQLVLRWLGTIPLSAAEAKALVHHAQLCAFVPCRVRSKQLNLEERAARFRLVRQALTPLMLSLTDEGDWSPAPVEQEQGLRETLCMLQVGLSFLTTHQAPPATDFVAGARGRSEWVHTAEDRMHKHIRFVQDSSVALRTNPPSEWDDSVAPARQFALQGRAKHRQQYSMLAAGLLMLHADPGAMGRTGRDEDAFGMLSWSASTWDAVQEVLLGTHPVLAEYGARFCLTALDRLVLVASWWAPPAIQLFLARLHPLLNARLPRLKTQARLVRDAVVEEEAQTEGMSSQEQAAMAQLQQMLECLRVVYSDLDSRFKKEPATSWTVANVERARAICRIAMEQASGKIMALATLPKQLRLLLSTLNTCFSVLQHLDEGLRMVRDTLLNLSPAEGDPEVAAVDQLLSPQCSWLAEVHCGSFGEWLQRTLSDEATQFIQHSVQGPSEPPPPALANPFATPPLMHAASAVSLAPAVVLRTNLDRANFRLTQLQVVDRTVLARYFSEPLKGSGQNGSVASPGWECVAQVFVSELQAELDSVCAEARISTVAAVGGSFVSFREVLLLRQRVFAMNAMLASVPVKSTSEGGQSTTVLQLNTNALEDLFKRSLDGLRSTTAQWMADSCQRDSWLPIDQRHPSSQRLPSMDPSSASAYRERERKRKQLVVSGDSDEESDSDDSDSEEEKAEESDEAEQEHVTGSAVDVWTMISAPLKALNDFEHFVYAEDSSAAHSAEIRYTSVGAHVLDQYLVILNDLVRSYVSSMSMLMRDELPCGCQKGKLVLMATLDKLIIPSPASAPNSGASTPSASGSSGASTPTSSSGGGKKSLKTMRQMVTLKLQQGKEKLNPNKGDGGRVAVRERANTAPSQVEPPRRHLQEAAPAPSATITKPRPVSSPEQPRQQAVTTARTIKPKESEFLDPYQMMMLDLQPPGSNPGTPRQMKAKSTASAEHLPTHRLMAIDTQPERPELKTAIAKQLLPPPLPPRVVRIPASSPVVPQRSAEDGPGHPPVESLAAFSAAPKEEITPVATVTMATPVDPVTQVDEATPAAQQEQPKGMLSKFLHNRLRTGRKARTLANPAKPHSGGDRDEIAVAHRRPSNHGKLKQPQLTPDEMLKKETESLNRLQVVYPFVDVEFLQTALDDHRHDALRVLNYLRSTGMQPDKTAYHALRQELLAERKAAHQQREELRHQQKHQAQLQQAQQLTASQAPIVTAPPTATASGVGKKAAATQVVLPRPRWPFESLSVEQCLRRHHYLLTFAPAACFKLNNMHFFRRRLMDQLQSMLAELLAVVPGKGEGGKGAQPQPQQQQQQQLLVQHVASISIELEKSLDLMVTAFAGWTCIPIRASLKELLRLKSSSGASGSYQRAFLSASVSATLTHPPSAKPSGILATLRAKRAHHVSAPPHAGDHMVKSGEDGITEAVLQRLDRQLEVVAAQLLPSLLHKFLEVLWDQVLRVGCNLSFEALTSEQQKLVAARNLPPPLPPRSGATTGAATLSDARRLSYVGQKVKLTEQECARMGRFLEAIMRFLHADGEGLSEAELQTDRLNLLQAQLGVVLLL